MRNNGVRGRVWLNPLRECDSGALMWECSEAHGTYVNASVTIRDCSKQVRLDFSFNDSATRRQRLKKLDLMIGELTKLRELIDGTD